MPRKKHIGKIGDLWQATHTNGVFVNFLLISHKYEYMYENLGTRKVNWKVLIVNTNHPDLLGYSFVWDNDLNDSNTPEIYNLLARKLVKKKIAEHNDNA